MALSLRSPAVWWFITLAALWVPVVYLLGAQWTFYEQYHYGWAVPFMCALFAWQRSRSATLTNSIASSKFPILFLLLLVFVVYWFSRLLQEANPLWRLASYGLAVSAGLITLLFVDLVGGKSLAARFIFPVAFFLVAVPWPTPIEGLVVQSLTRLNTSIVVELLGFVGIPAIMHGNVIELSKGSVGVEEACSGIRSLQATLMITLFFGEFFHFRPKQRVALIGAGIVLAMFFNVCRTFFLAWVASRSGIAAVEKWHDPAGIFVLACFVGTWLLALWMRRGNKGHGTCSPAAASRFPAKTLGTLRGLAMAAVVCVALVEISTEAWFRAHERPGDSVEWSAHWPSGNPSFKSRPVSDRVKSLMQFDESEAGIWEDAEGRNWLGFYFRWWPARNFYGRIRVALAKGHSPEICLQAAGWTMQSELESASVQVSPNLKLPFRRYVFQQGGRTLHVFFAVLEDQFVGNSAGMFRATHKDRLQAALAGSRNFGERSVEVAVSGFGSADEAWAAFQSQLPNWVQQNPKALPNSALTQNQ